MRRLLSIVFVSALVLGHGVQAGADSRSDGFGVTLTIQAAPSPVSITAEDLNFGTSAGEARFATSLVRVTATPGVTYTIYLDAGTLFQSPYRMLGGGSTGSGIPYLLAKDPNGTPWGDGVHPELGTGVTGGGTGAEQTFTVYGGTDPSATGMTFPAGTYTDFVVATVIF